MNIPFILGMACFLELITYILRFGFDFHSKSIQKKAHFPVRIHHMYLGFFLILLGLFFKQTIFPAMLEIRTQTYNDCFECINRT